MPPQTLSVLATSGCKAEQHPAWGHWPVKRVKNFRRLTRDQHLFPPRHSLQYRCLRIFAENWVELSEYEQHYIPTLSIVMREALLSHLPVYGEDNCLSLASFKILFQNAGDNWEDVQFLDFTGLLNDKFTINDLHKCFKKVMPLLTDRLDALCMRAVRDKGKAKATAIADSWEDEVDATPDTPTPFPAQLTTPQFTNISRLSLAHPGPHASWADLLLLSPCLNKLTHLSLAYWPRPTLTPNSSSTSMVSRNTRVAFSGTSHYADLDDDYPEAANILRRFSVNTYSLEWLDIEGCDWIKALTWHDADRSEPPAMPFSPMSPMFRHEQPAPEPGIEDEWPDRNIVTIGPDWNRAWQRVTYINVFQGWIPGHEQSLRDMPGGRVAMQIMRWLRKIREEGNGEEERKVDRLEKGMGVENWIERERVARGVGERIKERRKKCGGLWCEVDFGWKVEMMQKKGVE